MADKKKSPVKDYDRWDKTCVKVTSKPKKKKTVKKGK